MPDSRTSEPESAFVCDCMPGGRSVCHGLPKWGEREGKSYCVLHFPGKEKSPDFKAAFQTKLESNDFNFYEVWFPDMLSSEFEKRRFDSSVCFIYATFSDSVSFDDATFGGVAQFQGAKFRDQAAFQHAVFEKQAYFQDAIFSATAYFRSARFDSKVSFSSGTFHTAQFHFVDFKSSAFFDYVTFVAEATFDYGRFNGLAGFGNSNFNQHANFSHAAFRASAVFEKAVFKAGASFAFATFADQLKFQGAAERVVFSDKSLMDFQYCRMDKSEAVVFDTLLLHPHWFVNVNARKFDFINVQWNNEGNARRELELLKMKTVPSPHRFLAIACRKLAANSEENDRYREASHFRRMAMDAERLETWRGFGFMHLSWWYWLASGYGERPVQALIVLIGIFLVFGALYTQIGFVRWEPKVSNEADTVTAKRDDIGSPLKFGRALAYSAGVMTLQKPEPRPATAAAQSIVLLETILGPVQAALLALAIRRKFMR